MSGAVTACQLSFRERGDGDVGGCTDGLRSCEQQERTPSHDVVGSPEAHTAGKLLQEPRDGSGGAGGRRLEAHGGAVGGQEELPHRLQPGLALRQEATPGEGRGRE